MSKKPLWPIAVVALAVIGGAGVVAIALTSRPKDDAAARARLDAIITAGGDPLPPAECRARNRALVDRLARAAAWLQDSTIGAARPQDRDALALLSSIKGGDGAAEYWALLARARLVVEPTAEGALAAAKSAVARCPAMALAHNAVGAAEARAHHDALAVAAYKQALALAPDYVLPRFDLGLLALRDNDLAAAIAAFDVVLAKDPTHPRAHLARGQARLVAGDVPGALDDVEQATLRHPNDADAWMLLGQARATAGAHRTATEAFCKARALGRADATKLCPSE